MLNVIILILYEFHFLADCVSIDEANPTVEHVCKSLNNDQQLVTLFSENFVPVNCRSSLEGVWQFAYQVGILLYYEF